MHIKMNRIVPLAVAGAAAVAIAAAPTAAATTLATGSTVNQNPGNAQITAKPGAAGATRTSQLQQPFGGDTGALFIPPFRPPWRRDLDPRTLDDCALRAGSSFTPAQKRHQLRLQVHGRTVRGDHYLGAALEPRPQTLHLESPPQRLRLHVERVSFQLE